MIHYIAGPNSSPRHALAAARRLGCAAPVLLRRRGTRLGWIAQERRREAFDPHEAQQHWRRGEAVLLPGALKAALPKHRAAVRQTARFAERLAQGADPAELLMRAPYARRLTAHFDMLASYRNEGDAQEIATVEFDALKAGRVVSDNIWMKAAWLSFDEKDASLRLRFSFGIADIDDVSRDLARQRHAAMLAQTLFPECTLVANNVALTRQLETILQARNLEFLERILYFNAPNGGAQFHHDVERGHRGVVFAQLTGRTAWLAAPKPVLVDEMRSFCANLSAAEWQTMLPNRREARALQQCVQSPRALASFFDERDNTPVETVLNRVPAFTRRLVERGLAFLLQPGDVLLLPQRNIDTCCWHAVFCAGDVFGQALSFAIRAR